MLRRSLILQAVYYSCSMLCALELKEGVYKGSVALVRTSSSPSPALCSSLVPCLRTITAKMLLSLTSLLFATISLSASVQASSLVAAPALLARQSSSLLPLGQNCTADADCQSDKCWPVSWYYGQTVCSPSPAGVACTDGSTCISGE